MALWFMGYFRRLFAAAWRFGSWRWRPSDSVAVDPAAADLAAADPAGVTASSLTPVAAAADECLPPVPPGLTPPMQCVATSQSPAATAPLDARAPEFYPPGACYPFPPWCFPTLLDQMLYGNNQWPHPAQQDVHAHAVAVARAEKPTPQRVCVTCGLHGVEMFSRSRCVNCKARGTTQSSKAENRRKQNTPSAVRRKFEFALRGKLSEAGVEVGPRVPRGARPRQTILQDLLREALRTGVTADKLTDLLQSLGEDEVSRDGKGSFQ